MHKAANTALTESGLPPAVAKRGLTEFQWRALMNLFPGARGESVALVVDYCRARKLDPMKKPCHIVPMRVKDARSGEYVWQDVVMPGIYEYRTTAQRTGQYLGHSKPEYGPTIEHAGAQAPEFCELTVYRWNAASQTKVEYPVRVYFRECVATKSDGHANERWSRAPVQMLTKVAEAAALREAFPDELGGEHVAEEMEGLVLDVPTSKPAGKPVVAMPRAKSEAAATQPAMEAAPASAHADVDAENFLRDMKSAEAAAHAD